jgi:hypothetical protein
MRDAKELTTEITNYLNTYSFKDAGAEFCVAMSREHRTLQNSFTRLVLQWLEYIATDEYRTDDRNASGKEIAKELLAAFAEKKKEEGFTGITLEMVSLPSGYCRFI